MFEKINTKKARYDVEDTLLMDACFLDVGGWAHPFGCGPWHFEGETLTVYVEADSAAIAPFVPLPLKPFGPPIFRLTVHALRSDCGLGRAWAARNPRRSHFHEAVIAFTAAIDGVAGNWDPLMWTDAEAQLCVGREMYGFPMRLGAVGMTRRPALNGWRRGDIVTAEVSQDGRPLFSVEMSLEENGARASPAPVAPTPVFYTRRTLPRPDNPSISDVQLCRTTMQDLRVGEIWSGDGWFRIEHESLAALARGKILGARWSCFEMTKMPAELIETASVDTTMRGGLR
jgi:acetoacetate decarboxylase